jgi:hypothetical protein
MIAKLQYRKNEPKCYDIYTIYHQADNINFKYDIENGILIIPDITPNAMDREYFIFTLYIMDNDGKTVDTISSGGQVEHRIADKIKSTEKINKNKIID